MWLNHRVSNTENVMCKFSGGNDKSLDGAAKHYAYPSTTNSDVLDWFTYEYIEK